MEQNSIDFNSRQLENVMGAHPPPGICCVNPPTIIKLGVLSRLQSKSVEKHLLTLKQGESQPCFKTHLTS